MTPQTFHQDPAPEHPGFPFVVDGTTLSGEPWSEVFTTKPPLTLPASAHVDVALGAYIEDGVVKYAMPRVLRYVQLCCRTDDGNPDAPPERIAERFSSADRWAALMTDEDRFVYESTVGRVFMWLTEVMVQDPSGGRPASPDGSSATTGSSAAGSPS